jgi:hypothetical protein
MYIVASVVFLFSVEGAGMVHVEGSQWEGHICSGTVFEETQ